MSYLLLAWFRSVEIRLFLTVGLCGYPTQPRKSAMGSTHFRPVAFRVFCRRVIAANYDEVEGELRGNLYFPNDLYLNMVIRTCFYRKSGHAAVSPSVQHLRVLTKKLMRSSTRCHASCRPPSRH